MRNLKTKTKFQFFYDNISSNLKYLTKNQILDTI